MRKLNRKVWFRSHIDGSKHLYLLKQCRSSTSYWRRPDHGISMNVPYPCEKNCPESLLITHAWLEQGWNHHLRTPAIRLRPTFYPDHPGPVYLTCAWKARKRYLRYDNPVYAIGDYRWNLTKKYAMTRGSMQQDTGGSRSHLMGSRYAGKCWSALD